MSVITHMHVHVHTCMCLCMGQEQRQMPACSQWSHLGGLRHHGQSGEMLSTRPPRLLLLLQPGLEQCPIAAGRQESSQRHLPDSG